MSGTKKRIKSSRNFLFRHSKIILVGIACVFAFISFSIASTQTHEKTAHLLTQNLSISTISVRNIELRYRAINSSIARLTTESVSFNFLDTTKWKNNALILQSAFKEIESIAILDTYSTILALYPAMETMGTTIESVSETSNPAIVKESFSIYEGNLLKGYVLCTINLSKLITPLTKGYSDSTMVKITKDQQTVFVSENWESPIDAYTLVQTLSLQDNSYISASFSPTPANIHAIRHYYYKTLVIALLISLLTFLTLYFAQRFYASSKLNESRYRNLLDDVMLIALTIDGKGAITYCNDFFLSTTGWKREEVIGLDFFLHFFPSSLIDTERQYYLNTIENDLVIPSFEHVLVTKDGRTRWILFNNTALRNTNGTIIGVASLGEDVTERKLAEEKIIKQFGRMQALSAIDQAITSRQKLKTTLSIVLEQVITQLQAKAAAILLLDPETQTLAYRAGVGFKTDEITKTNISMGEGLTGKAALHREAFGACNLQSEESGFTRIALAKAENLCCYQTVPLLIKGKVLGVLEVFTTQPRTFDTEWLGYCKALAQQAAIAIDNDSLFYTLKRANTELIQAYDSTIEGWSTALDLRDRETKDHSLRVTEMTVKLCRASKMPAQSLIHVRRGALLHDIGKMGIPDNILLKKDALSEHDWAIIKKHPEYAYALLYPIEYLRPALDIPYCHHEKWDGTGYPRGLKGEEIPLSARLFAIVDVWDALLSDRPYRKGWPKEKVYDHIRSLSGTHFDPEAVRLFFAVINE